MGSLRRNFYTTPFKKESRVRSYELKKRTKTGFAQKQKCKMVFVDYRNSGTGFPFVPVKMLTGI